MTVAQLLVWLLQMREGDGDSGDGGGFCAEDGWAQGRGFPAGLGELVEFSEGPSAFGADGQDNAALSLCEGRGERESCFGFGKDDSCGRIFIRIGGDELIEFDGIVDRRWGCAAGLF